jgi:hypothetical protein
VEVALQATCPVESSTECQDEDPEDVYLEELENTDLASDELFREDFTPETYNQLRYFYFF